MSNLLENIILFINVILAYKLKSRIANNAVQFGWEVIWHDEKTLEIKKKVAEVPENFDLQYFLNSLVY